MYFLHNILYFFKNVYYTIFKKDTNINLFLKNLGNNWDSINPKEPLYYDILNLYIKYSKEYGSDNNISHKNIEEYTLNLENLEKNKNVNKIDINEHMKYYITGWYIHNMIPEEKKYGDI